MKQPSMYLMLAAIVPALWVRPAVTGDHSREPIIPNLPASPALSVSTVPPNGDLNPYGVAFVPRGFRHGGTLNPGDILVSNFNNSQNLQGTGTTIVRVTPHGAASVFFQGAQGLGLTTALGVLRRGFVLVGNVPTADGTCATVQPGSLLVLDQTGEQVAGIQNHVLLDGPWDLAIHDEGDRAQVFVSNVLSGTVARLELRISNHGASVTVEDVRQIASGYVHRCDPAALVVGPTGLAYDADKDVLYVASTGDNAIFAIWNARKTQGDAGMGKLVFQDSVHLHGPLALVLAPNGDLLTANGDAVNPDPNQPSEIVEFTPGGRFVAQFSVDSSGLGGAFGIALASSDDELLLAAVDDILNTLDVWMVR